MVKVPAPELCKSFIKEKKCLYRFGMMNNWNIHVTTNGKYDVWNFDILALHVFAVNTEHKLDTWNEQLEIQA